MDDSTGFAPACPAADLAARIAMDVQRAVAALRAAERDLKARATFAAHVTAGNRRRELDGLCQFATGLGLQPELDSTPPHLDDPTDHVHIA